MRNKKIITHVFADGRQDLPSTIKVKCNVTGEEKFFYTPLLIKTIANKYENSYSNFVDAYISREGKALQKENSIDELTGEEVSDLSLYKNFLLMEYNSIKNRKDTESLNKKEHIKDVWEKRFFNSDFAQELTQLS